MLPNTSDGKPAIDHNTKVKASIILPDLKKVDRNPAWIKYCIQDSKTQLYDGVYYDPPIKYQWTSKQPIKPKNVRIYECHVGMSSEEPKVATYRYFADNILPKIKDSGYTVVQIMAIMEHVYYACFGYQVTNFFAVCSRSGTPDDFKYLVDKAHELGLYVVLDLIHSHASTNVLDGINQFDGTDHQYFHGGPSGTHKLWDARLFNFSHWEVVRFLLSNLAWWIEEYHVDGFRFDAVTSILYKHHGIEYSFTGNYKEYFGDQCDLDGIVYLMLANYLIHTLKPEAITIAEDVSGMPTLCRPIAYGGIGFDYRLFMSIPDKWIKIIKESKDDNWNMGELAFTLTNRRYREPCIAYSESHDQAIVGDKTISMWLFGQEIYDGMSTLKPPSIVVDRGIALHKMIRLLTFTLGGEAYLNFMGNEFGHPEWIDFPRLGNNWSYRYCLRKWSLQTSKTLKFQFLYKFDMAIMKLDDMYGILNASHQYVSLAHETDKIIVYEKGKASFCV